MRYFHVNTSFCHNNLIIIHFIVFAICIIKNYQLMKCCNLNCAMRALYFKPQEIKQGLFRKSAEKQVNLDWFIFQLIFWTIKNIFFDWQNSRLLLSKHAISSVHSVTSVQSLMFCDLMENLIIHCVLKNGKLLNTIYTTVCVHIPWAGNFRLKN